MNINLRADAPDQSDIIDPKKLSEEVEKLKSLQSRIKTLEDQVKDLKEDEKAEKSCFAVLKSATQQAVQFAARPDVKKAVPIVFLDNSYAN